MKGSKKIRRKKRIRLESNFSDLPTITKNGRLKPLPFTIGWMENDEMIDSDDPIIDQVIHADRVVEEEVVDNEKVIDLGLFYFSDFV